MRGKVHKYVGSDVGSVNVHPGINIIRTRKNNLSQQAVKMLRTSVRLQQYSKYHSLRTSKLRNLCLQHI